MDLSSWRRLDSSQYVVLRRRTRCNPAIDADHEGTGSIRIQNQQHHSAVQRQYPGQSNTYSYLSHVRNRTLTDTPLHPQSESVLIQKIYTHFKKAPGPYKLGVLYVVDSVTRSWVEQARKAGQQPSASAAYGTYGAGVYRVTELLPMLMSDISSSAPEDQKVRPISYICPMPGVNSQFARLVRLMPFVKQARNRHNSVK